MAAVVAGAAVVGALLGAAAGETSPGEDPPSADVAVDAPVLGVADELLTAPDEAAASALAFASDQMVEVLGERTESTSVYALPDGTMATKLSSGPLWVRLGGDGSREEDWTPVDLTLVAGEDGAVRPVAHPASLVLSGGGDDPGDLAAMAHDGARFGFGWEGALPPPRLEGNRATYESVRPGVDMVVEATADGFEQFFVIRERPAGELTLPVDIWAEGAVLRDADGGLEAVGASGEVLASIPNPLMWDVAADEQRGQPVTMPVRSEGAGERAAPAVPGARMRGQPDVAEVARSMERHGQGRVRWDLTPQAGFLADPQTEYPVVVDPYYDIQFGVAFDTSVQSGVTYDLSGITELYMGSWNGGSTKTRSFIRFNTASVRYKHIFESRLYLYNQWSYSCNARKWEIWHTGSASTSTRWTAQPSWVRKLATINSAAGYYSYCGDAWAYGNVTSLVQERADIGSQVASFGIKATNENDSYAWKRFWSGNYSSSAYRPFLWVRYGSFPAAATSLTVAPQVEVGGVTYTGTPTPTLAAAVSDPDGGTLTAVFEVLASGAQVVTGEATAASGTTASWTVPEGELAVGVEYSFRVMVLDDYNLPSPWSAEKPFVIGSPTSGVTGARTTSPASECVVGAGRPVINSTTPTLRALVPDPDPGNLRAEFSVYDAATQALVWGPALTTARAAGAEHTVTIPAGLLADGGTYEWRVHGIGPEGSVGPAVSCEFTVDLQAPAEPGVSPVAGQPAVYAEDQASGGVGLAGQFELSDGGATDVVAFHYSLGDDSFRSSVLASSPVIDFTPTRAGVHVLYVRSVDAAGWVSPVRVYRFTVAGS